LLLSWAFDAALPDVGRGMIGMDSSLRRIDQNLKLVCLVREGLRLSSAEVMENPARDGAADDLVNANLRRLYSAAAVSRGLSAASPVSN
jgi:hypothetical protein